MQNCIPLDFGPCWPEVPPPIEAAFFILKYIYGGTFMAFFTSAVDTLQTLVVALGADLAVWGVINLLEGYGSDNRATRS